LKTVGTENDLTVWTKRQEWLNFRRKERLPQMYSSNQ